jgi:hypothetical protein
MMILTCVCLVGPAAADEAEGALREGFARPVEFLSV